MKKSFSIFTILIALAATASAEEATTVQTSGVGELRRASELMVAGGGANLATRLPTTVSKGEFISIQYQTAGATISDSFMVTGISIGGDSCSIESKHHNAEGMELVDRIVARPCSKLK